jgi:uncharacterized protein YjbJ (UPF0337 family)
LFKNSDIETEIDSRDLRILYLSILNFHCPLATLVMEEKTSDREREGVFDQAKGKIKEGLGKIADDESGQLKGKAVQLKGKAKEEIGKRED